MHACGRLVGDLNGVFQNALGDDVALRGGCRLRTDEDPELRVAVLSMLFQLLLQRAQPLGHQVDVLVGKKAPPPIAGNCLVLSAANSFRKALAFKYSSLKQASWGSQQWDLPVSWN